MIINLLLDNMKRSFENDIDVGKCENILNLIDDVQNVIMRYMTVENVFNYGFTCKTSYTNLKNFIIKIKKITIIMATLSSVSLQNIDHMIL